MCKVHSAVHLGLQFQVLTVQIPFSHSQYIVFDNIVTDAMTYAFNMRVSELCIMVSLDIQYKIKTLILHEWRYM